MTTWMIFYEGLSFRLIKAIDLFTAFKIGVEVAGREHLKLVGVAGFPFQDENATK